ncbi:MAG: S9 family peptidase, partial [Ignavibacteria bacterium]|nr:S9 family peptidase [Ignavibacteria bacterium]
KYPKVGEKNSVVSVWIYDLETKLSIKTDIGNDTDQYIPRIKWNKNGKLCITRLNRLQNKLELLLADASSGKTSVLFTESNKYYIDITDDLTFLNDNSFIWTSTMNGYNHIYHYAADGKFIKRITTGNWDVTTLYGLDEKKKLVYYQSAEVSPLSRAVYVIGLDGKNKKNITSTTGTNSAEFNPTFTYFLRKHSSSNTPNEYFVCKSDGKEVRLLEDNKSLKDLRSKYKISSRSFFNFTTKEGIILNGWIMKPLNFDSTKKYPVLMHVYGGPGDQQVLDMYMGNRDINLNYLCQQGYIIACADNRGSGARGEEFLKCTYLQLGKLETEDQISGARYLQTLPYVDANRIGIIGWSYGGYMS